MITLYQYNPHWGLPNASPFCMKLECILRMAQLPYQTKSLRDPRKSPTGKLPFIKDGEHTIADSSLIVQYLQKTYQVDLDKHLDDRQKAQAIAIQRLFEDHLYWVIVYSRWIAPEGWSQLQKDFFSKMPAPLRLFVPAMVRSGVKKSLHGQGLGRHHADDIYNLALQDLQAIAYLLEQNTYLLSSDKPAMIDAIGYAFIANILQSPIQSPLKDFVQKHKCFERYCKAMKGVWLQYNH